MCLDFGVFRCFRHISRGSRTRSRSGRRPRLRWLKAPQSALTLRGGAELGHDEVRRTLEGFLGLLCRLNVLKEAKNPRHIPDGDEDGESCVLWLWGPEDKESRDPHARFSCLAQDAGSSCEGAAAVICGLPKSSGAEAPRRTSKRVLHALLHPSAHVYCHRAW